MTIGNSAFCRDLYLTGVHFRGELQYVGHVLIHQNSRNSWWQIERRTICLAKTQGLYGTYSTKFV